MEKIQGALKQGNKTEQKNYTTIKKIHKNDCIYKKNLVISQAHG